MSIGIPFVVIFEYVHILFAKKKKKKRGRKKDTLSLSLSSPTATKKGKLKHKIQKKQKFICLHLLCIFPFVFFLLKFSLPHYLWSAVQSSHYLKILRFLPLFKPCVTTLLLFLCHRQRRWQRYAVNWNLFTHCLEILAHCLELKVHKTTILENAYLYNELRESRSSIDNDGLQNHSRADRARRAPHTASLLWSNAYYRHQQDRECRCCKAQ